MSVLGRKRPFFGVLTPHELRALALTDDFDAQPRPNTPGSTQFVHQKCPIAQPHGPGEPPKNQVFEPFFFAHGEVSGQFFVAAPGRNTSQRALDSVLTRSGPLGKNFGKFAFRHFLCASMCREKGSNLNMAKVDFRGLTRAVGKGDRALLMCK